MELSIATFEDCENSMTPARRSFLLRREQAKESWTRRIRSQALARQAGLFRLLHPTDPRHRINVGEWSDDLRGLVNPDGSLHIWPLEDQTHRRYAEDHNLLDRFGQEGVHFYVYLGLDEPSGSQLVYNRELFGEVVIVLRELGVLEAAKKSERVIVEPEDESDDWITPEPEPYDPWDDYYDDPWDDFAPDPPSIPHHKPTEWVVTTSTGVFVATSGAYGWTHQGFVKKQQWTYAEAWDEANKRDAWMIEQGLKTRYIVMSRSDYNQNQAFIRSRKEGTL